MYKYCNKWTPYLFIIPSAILLTLFFFIPFFQTIIMSFKDYSTDLWSPLWTGWSNYKFLLSSSDFYKILLNTFIYLFVAVPILVILPLIVAVFLNQKIRVVNLYKILIYLPVIVSIVVAAIAFKWLYAEHGILNFVIQKLFHKSFGWLTDPDIALYSVIIVTVWKGVGYYMMIYLAALMGVPKDLYEASEIDGAGEFQKHLTVTVPYIMPTIALVTTISSISALKVFVEIFVMTKGGPINSTQTIVYYIYERAFENLDLGVASAAAVILLILVLIFSIVNLLIFEKDKYTL